MSIEKYGPESGPGIYYGTDVVYGGVLGYPLSPDTSTFFNKVILPKGGSFSVGFNNDPNLKQHVEARPGTVVEFYNDGRIQVASPDEVSEILSDYPPGTPFEVAVTIPHRSSGVFEFSHPSGFPVVAKFDDVQNGTEVHVNGPHYGEGRGNRWSGTIEVPAGQSGRLKSLDDGLGERGIEEIDMSYIPDDFFIHPKGHI